MQYYLTPLSGLPHDLFHVRRAYCPTLLSFALSEQVLLDHKLQRSKISLN